MDPIQSTAVVPTSSPGVAATPQSTNLGDILERVLDRGLVITGDIRVSLLDIELITIKLRLLIASVDTARSIGINWWENDPWLSTNQDDLREENRLLRERVEALESGGRPALEAADEPAVEEAEEPDRKAAAPRRRRR
jgi:hypothetical protein